MRVGLKWLEEYVDIDVPVRRVVELLDLSGTKVEAINAPAESLEGVVVAEVLEITDHPNADNLTLVDVMVDGEQERVVCGARNFAVGDKVPYARVGARLPELEITERKIRGEISRGMLCSAAELGVSKDHSGILVLPPDAHNGADVVTLLGLDDTILELEITPNRPDCMGMIGIAREVAALLGNELRTPEIASVVEGAGDGPVTVRLDDPEGCPRYVAHYVPEVAVGPSVDWMAARLLAAGIRPISNVVDTTNYVLIETGHPLHAFDAQQVHEQTIVVRRAKRGERLVTLDGIERKADREDLMIADPKHALAFAGVMGGAASEVGSSTTDVILEAAYFDPTTIARTSRRHGLRTEASARFERGLDPDAVVFAAARCSHLLSLTGAAAATAQVVDEYPVRLERQRVTLRPDRTSRLLGYELSSTVQADHLRSVGILVRDADGALDAEVPLFRPDIQQEVDLIEEVARLAGFEQLPSSLPKGAVGELEPVQRAERTLRRTLVGLGLSEAWTTSLGAASDLDALHLADDHPARRMVALANPMSEHEDRMRTTLLPGLLRSAARNVAHRAEAVALFEIARVFEPASGHLPQEPLTLAAVFAGARRNKTWLAEPVPWGFFEAKGVLEAAVGALGISLTLTPREGMPYHPTRAALVSIGSTPAGSIGELHPAVAQGCDVPEGTVAFEIALAPVFAALPAKVKVPELPRFPPIVIDVAVVVDERIPAESVETAIAEAGEPELSSIRLFDVYRGEQIRTGLKSLAYALQLRAVDRTLTDDDAVAVRDRIVERLRVDLGAELRA